MVRKIIQLVSQGIKVGVVSKGSIFSLCDDGTVWRLDEDNDFWIRVADIPQNKAPTVERIFK